MAEPITIQKLIDAGADSDSLEVLVNGDENAQVITRLGETYPSAKKAIKIMFENGGLPAEPFATLAKIQTDGTSLADGQLAMVYNETANNGLYVKTAGAWVKSVYDPVTLATTKSKTYTDEKILSDTFQKKQGKNLFEGTYVQGSMQNSAAPAFNIVSTSPQDGHIAVIAVKPLTTYTISKTNSNRFRVGINTYNPIGHTGTAYAKSVLPQAAIDAVNQFTFTTESDSKFLVICTDYQGATPAFMQVEEGAVKTAWVSYGFAVPKFEQNIGSSTAVDNTVGNAKYIERGLTNVYTDATKTTIATDDSDALQAIFNAGGNIQLDSNKIYAVSKPLLVDLSRIKYLNGNGATIVTISDGIVLDIFGNKTTDAGPDMATGISMQSAGEVIHNLKVTSASGLTGQAVRVRNTFKLDLDIQCYLMREGVVIEGYNRNIRCRPKSYAMQTNCLRFASGSNLHQGQFYVSDMSYANKIIFMDNAEVYNAQFIGGDIETGQVWKDVSTKESVEQHSIIHIRADTNAVNDVSFTGITFESHRAPNKLIKLEGGVNSLIRYVQFNGCFYGNSAADCFEVGGVLGLKINGTADAFPNNFINFIGDSFAVDIDVMLSRTGTFIKSFGSHTISNVTAKVNGYDLKGSLVDIDCNINGFTLKNSLTHVGTFGAAFDNTKGLVNINAVGRNVRMVSVSDNGFRLPNSINDIVKVIGTPARVRVQNNDADKAGAYPATATGIESSGNYAS